MIVTLPADEGNQNILFSGGGGVPRGLQQVAYSAAGGGYGLPCFLPGGQQQQYQHQMQPSSSSSMIMAVPASSAAPALGARATNSDLQHVTILQVPPPPAACDGVSQLQQGLQHIQVAGPQYGHPQLVLLQQPATPPVHHLGYGGEPFAPMSGPSAGAGSDNSLMGLCSGTPCDGAVHDIIMQLQQQQQQQQLLGSGASGVLLPGGAAPACSGPCAVPVLLGMDGMPLAGSLPGTPTAGSMHHGGFYGPPPQRRPAAMHQHGPLGKSKLGARPCAAGGAARLAALRPAHAGRLPGVPSPRSGAGGIGQQHRWGIDPRLVVGTPAEVAWEVLRRVPNVAPILELRREETCLRNLPVAEDLTRDADKCASHKAAGAAGCGKRGSDGGCGAGGKAGALHACQPGSPAAARAASEGDGLSGGGSAGDAECEGEGEGEGAAQQAASAGGMGKADLLAPLDPEQLVQEQGLVRACRGLPARVRDDLIRAARLAVTRTDASSGAAVPGTGLLPFFWRVQANLCWLLRQPATLKGQLLPGQVDFVSYEQRQQSSQKTVAQRVRLAELAVLLHGLLQVPPEDAAVMAAVASAAGLSLP
jgi:hypothetical protein